MFKDKIFETPFANDSYANDFFGSTICDDAIYTSPDQTFISTLRALVYPRIGDNVIHFRRDDISVDSLRGAANYMSRITQNVLRVFVLPSMSDENLETARAIFNDKLEEQFPGWHRVHKVTAFFEKAFNAFCYVNPDAKNTILVADIGTSVWKWHYIQCSIPVILPWFFAGEQALTQVEVDLLGSLSKKESSDYVRILDELSSQYNFRNDYIRKHLFGFETIYMKKEADAVRERIANANYKIDDLTQEISRYIANQREDNLKLIGLETEIARGGSEETSEVMHFFLNNDRLVLRECTEHYLTFFVKEYLTNFNEDLAETLISNRNSFFYKPNRNDMSRLVPADDVEMFLRAVFIDQTLRIRMCAAYQFELGRNGYAMSGYFGNGNGTRLAPTYIPNPHIEIHSCLGGYRNPITEFVRRNDYVGAITQCIASCQSLNVDEYPTMAPFMIWLYTDETSGVNTRCIELPDGRVVKMKEAIEYLKSVKEASDE